MTEAAKSEPKKPIKEGFLVKKVRSSRSIEISVFDSTMTDPSCRWQSTTRGCVLCLWILYCVKLAPNVYFCYYAQACIEFPRNSL